MERYNLNVVLVSLERPSPAVLLADPQWTSSDEHTCSRMETTSHRSSAGSLRGSCPASAHQQLAQWNTNILLRIESELPPCRTMKWDALYFITRGFILKTIQWHIHTGSWSLGNCWREGSTLPYKGCSWIYITLAVGLTDGLGLDGDRCIRMIPRH